jgi:hypothetical protein
MHDKRQKPQRLALRNAGDLDMHAEHNRMMVRGAAGAIGRDVSIR